MTDDEKLHLMNLLLADPFAHSWLVSNGWLPSLKPVTPCVNCKFYRDGYCCAIFERGLAIPMGRKATVACEDFMLKEVL